MRKRSRILNSIEWALVVSLLASFSVVGLGGLFFGFKMAQWAEWQGILIGGIGTLAGVVGAFVGLRIALNERLMNLKEHGHFPGWIKY